MGKVRLDKKLSMVDVTAKPEVQREATAKGRIKLKAETIQRINEGQIEKGDPFNVAKIAGILAAKGTSSLIPLCHPLPITSINIDLRTSRDFVEVEATVKTKAQTGVEMEALTAVSIALLTIWDMTKQYEKDKTGQYPSTLVRDIRVVRKLKRS
jgi:cyclic pyranopterin phosphate synthase